MKYASLFFLFCLSLLLCGCNPFASYKNRSTAWNAQNLEKSLEKNYPIGSDEKELISDFTAHQYKYSENKCLNSLPCRKYLISAGYCSWWRGVENEMVIEWASDDKGKIKDIRSYKTVCILTP